LLLNLYFFSFLKKGIIFISLLIGMNFIHYVHANELINDESKYFNSLLIKESKTLDNNLLLNQKDKERYIAIFALQKLGKWKEADSIISLLDNKILIGHVKYQKLMHPTKYRSNYKELKKWLSLYSDHPMSKKIWELAKKRKPKNTKSLLKPENLSRLPGYGLDYKSIVPIKNFSVPRKYYTLYKKIRSLVKRGRPTNALKELNKLDLPIYIRDDLKGVIAAGYYAVGKDKLSYKLAINAANRSGVNNPILYWRAGLTAYRLNQKEEALIIFLKLANMKKDIWLKSAGAYWAAKIYLEFNNKSAAKNNFIISAKQLNTFYGQLAIEYLGYKENISWEINNKSSFFDLDILNNEHIKRAIALSSTGKYGEADQEIRFVYGALGKKYMQQLLELTNYLNLPAVQLRLGDKMLQEGKTNYLALYPTPKWFVNNPKKIDQVLIWSLIRKESSFYLKAKSPRGARGLMQIMPSTARVVTGNRSIRGSNLWKLNDLDYNISIGQDLLLRLMNKEGILDSLIPVLISWNAGPTKYKKWNKKIKMHSDPLLYIESIPSYETRWFVKEVLKNMWVYRDKFKQDKPSRRALSNNFWPKYKNLSF
jgi:soluble lytic murein transglycosylase